MAKTVNIYSLTRVSAVEWHTIYPWSIDSNSIVLDIGANRGRFSTKMIKKFNCFCHAIEAHPRLYKNLQETEKLKSYHYAVSDSKEKKRTEFSLNENILGSSIFATADELQIESVEVPSITLQGFVEKHNLNKIDLIKIDIEGAEIGVFDSTSDHFLQQIPQITIEFHDFCGKIADQEVKRIIDRLEGLGFWYIKMSRHGNQDVLFVNKKLLGISFWEYWYMKTLIYYFLGIMRVTLGYLKVKPNNFPYYI